jgi:alanine racemase
MKCFNDYIVDTKILKSNAENIKNNIGPSCKFCAVVKANAYGIGLETVCKTLYGIADFFAVANIKEAMSIRVFDKKSKILILGYIDNNQIEVISNNNISISVGSVDQLQELSKINTPIKIHLQINTGLNRYGIRTINEYKQCIKLITNNNNLILEGVYSHFATKQNDVKFAYKQYLRFTQFKRIYVGDNIIYHIANSFATEYSKNFHMNMVRSGFLLYGYAKNNIGNKPVMSICSKIINIISVRKGDSIGYDRTFISDKNLTIAVVSIGYADGLSRRLSNNFSLLVKGKKCRIVGRVCMDAVMIDVTGINDVKIGDRVTVLGRDGDRVITLKDYADIIETSEYEVLCAFNYRRANYIAK